MNFDSVPLEVCKQLGCRALHYDYRRGNYWCAARLMGEQECIHPDNREQEIKNEQKEHG